MWWRAGVTGNHCLGQSAVSGVSGWKGGDLSRLLRVVLPSESVCVGVYNIEMWNIAGTVLVVTVISAVCFFSDWNLTDLAIYTKEIIVLWCYITSTQYAHWLKHLKRCRLNAFINQVVIHSYIHTIQSVPFCFFLQNQNHMLNLLYSLNVHKHTNNLLWFTTAYI